MPPITLTESADGQTITLPLGAEIHLSLHENPTTGYIWAIEPFDESPLALADTRYAPASPLVGSGGTRTFTFQALQLGETSLALKHWRSWEGDSSIIGRFGVTVSVYDPNLRTV